MDQQMTYAPGLPGWINRLPADKQETARKIWLTDGRTILSLKEMIEAKRHELNAIQDMPNPDENAVAALAKEIGATEEKLLMAEFAFNRKLEKEGIPTWGRADGMDMKDKGGKKEKDDKKERGDKKEHKGHDAEKPAGPQPN